MTVIQKTVLDFSLVDFDSHFVYLNSQSNNKPELTIAAKPINLMDRLYYWKKNSDSEFLKTINVVFQAIIDFNQIQNKQFSINIFTLASNLKLKIKKMFNSEETNSKISFTVQLVVLRLWNHSNDSIDECLALSGDKEVLRKKFTLLKNTDGLEIGFIYDKICFLNTRILTALTEKQVVDTLLLALKNELKSMTRFQFQGSASPISRDLLLMALKSNVFTDFVDVNIYPLTCDFVDVNIYPLTCERFFSE